MASAKKIAQKPLNIFIVCIAILVLATIGSLTLKNFSQTSVDCKAITDSSQVLINNSKYKEAYNKLIPYQKKCGVPPSHNEITDEKIQRLTFHSHLAVSSYVQKKPELAKSEAEKGLAILKSLSNTDKRKVPISLITDMVLIKDEIY